MLITLGSQTSLRTDCGPHRPSPFLVWLALVQRSGKGADTWGAFPQWAAKLSSTGLHSPFSEGMATLVVCKVSCTGGLHAPAVIDVVGGFVHT